MSLMAGFAFCALVIGVRQPYPHNVSAVSREGAC
jgi:hypothetical protein